MLEKTFIKLVKAALNDEEIYNKLGDLHYKVVRAALADALSAEINFEDGKSEPGRTVEKTEKVNMIEWLAKYIPGIEGALRGLQADVDVARNRATQTRDMVLVAMSERHPEILEILPTSNKRRQPPRIEDRN